MTAANSLPFCECDSTGNDPETCEIRGFLHLPHDIYQMELQIVAYFFIKLILLPIVCPYVDDIPLETPSQFVKFVF